MQYKIGKVYEDTKYGGKYKLVNDRGYISLARENEDRGPVAIYRVVDFVEDYQMVTLKGERVIGPLEEYVPPAEPMYSIGAVFELTYKDGTEDEDGKEKIKKELYILAQVESWTVNLISLDDGNRFTKAFKVDNILSIPFSVLQKEVCTYKGHELKFFSKGIDKNLLSQV